MSPFVDRSSVRVEHAPYPRLPHHYATDHTHPFFPQAAHTSSAAPSLHVCTSIPTMGPSHLFPLHLTRQDKSAPVQPFLTLLCTLPYTLLCSALPYPTLPYLIQPDLTPAGVPPHPRHRCACGGLPLQPLALVPLYAPLRQAPHGQRVPQLVQVSGRGPVQG